MNRGVARSGQSGFTLLEALIAVVIVAVAFGAASMTAIGAVNGAEESRIRFLASLVAKNRLVHISVSEEWSGAGVSSGEEKQGNIDFRWEATMSQTPNPDFIKVDIEVSSQEAKDRKLSKITGYITRYGRKGREGA